MSDTLQDLESLLSAMSADEKAELDGLLEKELKAIWLPNPGPQTEALHSEADILLYGGAAGGGKSALLVGCAALNHSRSLIVRRQSVELDGMEEEIQKTLVGHGKYLSGNLREFRFTDCRNIKLGGMKTLDDWRAYAGRARDYMGFDEAGEFAKEQVFSLMAWNRSTDPGQRCRVILGSNPPRGGEGDWLIEEFSPWLDDLFPDPAVPGELRWAIVVGGITRWVDGPGIHSIDGEEYTARSRTFIPARLDDNPYLRETGYRAQLQSLPEPLRSQLLHGDFTAGRVDHEWQVIPSDWVKAAQQRWQDAPEKRRRMIALAADPSGKGPDDTTIAALHDQNWFAEVETVKDADGTSGQGLAGKILGIRRDNADISLDLTGGWGSPAMEALETHHRLHPHGWVFSQASGARTKDQSMGFVNTRAELWWSMRESLDPESLEDVMLPPSKRLFAELTAPRWMLRKASILVESKEEIKKRLGSSTDEADAVIMAWGRRHMIAFNTMKPEDMHTVESQSDPFADLLS